MPRAPQQERSRQRFDRVLDAAEELLAQEGVEGFAIRPLAARAGVSTGWVYGFVDDREALLDTVALRGLTELDGLLAAAAAEHPANPAQLAAAALEATIDWARRRPGARIAYLARRTSTAVAGADERQNARLSALLCERGLPAARAAVAVEAAEAVIALAFRSDPQGDGAVLDEGRRLLRRAVGP